MIAFILVLAASVPDYQSYGQILQKYVNTSGKVQYSALHNDIAPLSKFVDSLAAVSPVSHPALFPTKEAKLAYWVNTYNALVVHAFASEYPKDKARLKSKVGQYQFFYRRKFKVGGVLRSLDDIEAKSIRPLDNRIHFSIVCASESCPWLSNEAFTEQNVMAKLEDRAKLFLNQDRNVKVDSAKRTIHLSKIFDWFQKDFAPNQVELLKYIAKYRQKDGGELASGSWKVLFFDYDWSLNENPN
jgi:hypothetical protein